MFKWLKQIFKSNGDQKMEEENDTLNLSPTPNMADKVGYSVNGSGPAAMSSNSAQQQIMQQAQMASMKSIPGQIQNTPHHRPQGVRRQLERQPMAQYANYEQPPVQRMAPSQMVAPQHTMHQEQPMMSQQPYYPPMQQPPVQPQYYQQPYYPPMQQPPMQQPQMPPQQMTDSFGAPFAEIYVTSANEYECWIDLPSIDTSKLGVVVRENTLHVTCERKLHSDSTVSKKGKKATKVVAVQSSVPNYLMGKCKFSWPFGKPVDEDTIKAEYVNGQLHVVLAILSSAKGVKVSVKV